MTLERRLKDLSGIGKAMLKDFELLGVSSVPKLAEQDPDELYERLCAITCFRHDICCLDVFRCAVEQAKDPKLPVEQKNWWYWSRLRKSKE